jgi:hypothetical protein
VAAKVGSFSLNVTTNAQARGETGIITTLAGRSDLIKIASWFSGEARHAKHQQTIAEA